MPYRTKGSETQSKAFTPDLTRAGHRGCSTDAFPGSRLPGRPLGWTGRTPPPLRARSAPVSLDADRGRRGRPDRLKHTNRAGKPSGKRWPAALPWQGPCAAIYGTSAGAIILAAGLKPLLTGITSTNA